MRFFLFLAAATSAGCAIGPDPERLDRVESAVIGGSEDATDVSVVSIVAGATTSAPELCTGTIVAPRVVLTAGHCTRGQDPSTLVVGIGASAKTPDRTISALDVITYPGFTGTFDDIQAGLDLGAILLAEDAALPSVPLFAGDESTLSAPATVVGFGQLDAGDLESRGTRRSATVTPRAACSSLLAFGDATANACHGDSGGPLLVGGAIAGVVSYGDEMHCATASYAVRVDRYAAWIQSIIAGNDAGSCAACPPRANDCAADASATPPDASADATTARTPASNAGGCALGGAGRPSEGASLLAAVVVAAVRRRRRGHVTCQSRN